MGVQNGQISPPALWAGAEPEGSAPNPQKEEFRMTIEEAVADIQQNILPTMPEKTSIRMALETLKMQIPQKVIREEWSISRCPCYGSELGEWTEDGQHKDYDYLKICDCGQKLDWNI